MDQKHGEWRVIELKDVPSEGRLLRFTRAEVPADPHVPFAVIRYALPGQPEEKLGLRLDVDKGVFLDHFEDRDSEESANRALPAILAILNSHST